MATDKYTSNQLKVLMDHPAWESLLKVLAERLRALEHEGVTGQNEFETLRSLHVKNGKIAGLTDFFNDVERGAYEQ